VAGIAGGGFFAAVADFAAVGEVFRGVEFVVVLGFGFAGAGWGFVGGVT